MAYDEALAERVRGHLEGLPELSEKKMFGGLAFLLAGRMAVAASGQGGLLLRCDPAETDALADRPGVAPFDMGRGAMAGWLHLEPSAVATEADLERWVAVGVGYAQTLPPK